MLALSFAASAIFNLSFELNDEVSIFSGVGEGRINTWLK